MYLFLQKYMEDILRISHEANVFEPLPKAGANAAVLWGCVLVVFRGFSAKFVPSIIERSVFAFFVKQEFQS